MSLIAVVVVAALLIPHWTAWMFSLPMVCVLYIDLMGVLQVCFIAIYVRWLGQAQDLWATQHVYSFFLPIRSGRESMSSKLPKRVAVGCCSIYVYVSVSFLTLDHIAQCCFLHRSFHVDRACCRLCYARFNALL